jgi:hypothetical protein
MKQSLKVDRDRLRLGGDNILNMDISSLEEVQQSQPAASIAEEPLFVAFRKGY